MAENKEAVYEIQGTSCELLTISQVSAILKINRNTVYDLIKSGLLKSIKLGCTKVSTFAIEDFIKKCEAGEIEYKPDSALKNKKDTPK